MFGQPAATAASATPFGSTAPQSGGFSFGGTNNASTTPSLFGSTSTAATPSLFGSTSTAATPSLFGSTSTAATPSFGAPAMSQPQQQPGSFGTNTTFGGSSQPNAGAASVSAAPSLFGANRTAPTNTFGGTNSMFGNSAFNATSNSSTLGTNTANTSSLFGSTANKPLSSFGFSSAGSTFGANQQNMNNMTPQQRDKMIYELLLQRNKEEWEQKGQRTLNDITPENIWQSLALMKSWWDPESPNCRFKTYFYNMVPPNEVHLYQRPANQDQKAWDEAQKKNPDPTCMVPTQAIGFHDIEKRMEVQNIQSQAHKAKLQEIDQRIKKLQETTLSENAAKLIEAKRHYMEVTQRVINFLKHTQVLRQKGLSITPEEERMRTQFESIQDQLQQSEQFHGTLSQMWAQLQLIKESGRKYGSIGGVDEWDSVSSSHVEEITKILDEQQRGIQHTIDVLLRDMKDVNSLQHR